MNLQIREEREIDYQDVFDVNRIAFGREDEAKLVHILRNSHSFIPGLSIVALSDQKIIGHILFTKLKIKSKSGQIFQSLTLAPMAVLPKYQNMGVGGQLIKYGFQKASAFGYQSVIVLGHEDYYPRFGFSPASQWNITCPFEVPENIFMGIELIEGGLTGVNGVVEYPAEFHSI